MRAEEPPSPRQPLHLSMAVRGKQQVVGIDQVLGTSIEKMGRESRSLNSAKLSPFGLNLHNSKDSTTITGSCSNVFTIHVFPETARRGQEEGKK